MKIRKSKNSLNYAKDLYKNNWSEAQKQSWNEIESFKEFAKIRRKEFLVFMFLFISLLIWFPIVGWIVCYLAYLESAKTYETDLSRIISKK